MNQLIKQEGQKCPQQLECGNGNVDGDKNGQTKGWNYNNFNSNLAMMVIYFPVIFCVQLDKAFLSHNPETKMLTDKWTNKLTKLHQFRKQTSYDGDLSPCHV